MFAYVKEVYVFKKISYTKYIVRFIPQLFVDATLFQKQNINDFFLPAHYYLKVLIMFPLPFQGITTLLAWKSNYYV